MGTENHEGVSHAAGRDSHWSTARAHWRPSLIAQTISDWPRRASPAAKTPSTEVAYAGAAAFERGSRSTPSCSSTSGSGPRKPIASSTRSAGRVSSVSAIGSKGGAPALCAQWIALTLPLPLKCVVLIENSRSPPSFSAYEPRSFIGQRGHGVRSSGRETGGSPTSSICVTDAGPSRCALPTQSAPVSPPPITITCFPAAEMTRSGGGASDTKRFRW